MTKIGKYSKDIIFGKEPDFKGITPTQNQLANAYNWYSGYYAWDDVKKFVLQLLIIKKTNQSIIDACNRANGWDFHRATGWHCRMLLKGAILPKDIMAKVWKNIGDVVRKFSIKKENKVVVVRRDIRFHNLMEILEGKLDDFIEGRIKEFDIIEWMKVNNVTAVQAGKIADKYKPIYKEMYDALIGKDEELRFAYSNIKPAKMKSILDFMKGYVGAGVIVESLPKVPRKARKKKVKPASVLVAKLNYKANDPTYKINSIPPKNIVGGNQLWMFNTKTRFLTVFHAETGKTLSIKGSTLMDFDAKLSLSKKVRKPELILPEVLNTGKVGLRRIMDGIKAVNSPPTGRINKDTLLMRVL